MEAKEFQDQFCERLQDEGQFAAMFDFLPEAYFFSKDEQGCFVFANRAMAEALGLKGPEEMLGRTDYDFFQRDLAEKYREEDRAVMKSGRALPDQVWLVPNREGELRWYLSSKRPLFSKAGEVIGIAGVMRDFTKAGSVLEPYEELSAVIQHVQSSYAERIEVLDLAKLAHLSVSQLERRFKKLFKISPLKYITQVRVHAACRLLTNTRKSVSEIALECGFYDQSHFTKQFKVLKSMTPSQFRRSYVDRGQGRGKVRFSGPP